MGGTRCGRPSLIVLPDVNVLVYAFRRESTRHDDYATWLAELLRGVDEVALTEGTLTGFLRIVTNPRVYADPAPTSEAMRFLEAVRSAHRRRWVTVTDSVWSTFAAITGGDSQLRGNLVPDAWLAALAVAHGCHLATADRGFARFGRLQWFDPAPG